MSEYTTFRYPEMIFSPDFEIFKADTEDERYVNGYFIFNVSKLISFMPSGMDKGFVTQKTVSVDSCFEYVNMSAMEEEHIKAADLERPIIFIEIAPDTYNLADGRHRICKAIKRKVKVLPAYFVRAEFAEHFLQDTEQYRTHCNYWNTKVADYEQDMKYPYDRRFMQPLREWTARTDSPQSVWRKIRDFFDHRKMAEVELDPGRGEWFSISYDAGEDTVCISKAFYNHSVRCSTVYRMDEEKLSLAMRNYSDWMQGNREVRKEIAAEIGRGTKYFMAFVRVFGEMYQR